MEGGKGAKNWDNCNGKSNNNKKVCYNLKCYLVMSRIQTSFSLSEYFHTDTESNGRMYLTATFARILTHN